MHKQWNCDDMVIQKWCAANILERKTQVAMCSVQIANSNRVDTCDKAVPAET